jgi:hypothetical protein
MLGDKCLGKADIYLEKLLELQNLKTDEGEYNLIVDRMLRLMIWLV